MLQSSGKKTHEALDYRRKGLSPKNGEYASVQNYPTLLGRVMIFGKQAFEINKRNVSAQNICCAPGALCLAVSECCWDFFGLPCLSSSEMRWGDFLLCHALGFSVLWLPCDLLNGKTLKHIGVRSLQIGEIQPNGI